MRIGEHGEYSYLVAETDSLVSLVQATIACHEDLSLATTTYDDGGSVAISAHWRAAGWEQVGRLFVHPSVARGLESLGGYLDVSFELYLLDTQPPLDWQPEVFDGQIFLPIQIPELYREQDVTWDWRGCDWLIPIQDRFWEQMERIRPVSYLATGDQIVVVSRRLDFIEPLRAAGQ